MSRLCTRVAIQDGEKRKVDLGESGPLPWTVEEGLMRGIIWR